MRHLSAPKYLYILTLHGLTLTSVPSKDIPGNLIDFIEKPLPIRTTLTLFWHVIIIVITSFVPNLYSTNLKSLLLELTLKLSTKSRVVFSDDLNKPNSLICPMNFSAILLLIYLLNKSKQFTTTLLTLP